MEIGPEPKYVFWVRSSCAFLSVDNSSNPLVNTHTECFHWCRQETIHCAHVFAENMYKLQAATFTHGCERKVKQASHIAAAGCVAARVCIKLSEIDRAIPFVCNSPCTPFAKADLFPYQLDFAVTKYTVFSSSPSTQTARTVKPKISHSHLLCCRPSCKASK